MAVLLSLALMVAGCRDATKAEGAAPGISESLQPQKPNIIWLVLDACRAANLSCYGYERETSPNLDKLAARGVLFEQNYSQATWTIPSVASYMTGRYFAVPSVGRYGYTPGNDSVRLPPDNERLLPEILARNGYETAMVTLRSAWFTRHHRLPRAFDHFLGIEPRRGPHVSFEELNVEIDKYLGHPRSKPFFLYVHAFDTHFPHFLLPPYDRWIDKDYDAGRVWQDPRIGAKASHGGAFSTEDQDYLRALYDGSIAYADAQVGILLERLAALGLLETTLIIVGSDHGEALGEDGKTVAHGGSKTYDEVTHVPLIMAGPGIPAGRRVERLTENVDIVPTLLDLLSIETQAQMDGRSLLPQRANSQGPAAHDYVFVKGHIGSTFSLRNSRFKFEYKYETKKEQLYRVPDRLGTRTDVLEEHHDIAAAMKQVLFERHVPRWKAYSRLPLMAVSLPTEWMIGKAQGSAVSKTKRSPSTHGKNDGKWALYNGQLFAASFAEKVPPLTFRKKVRPGEYTVLMDLYVEKAYGGQPASSVAIKLKGESEFRTITRTLGPEESAGFVFTEVGTCNIADGSFEATVAQGDRAYWTGFKGFVLLARTERAEAEFDFLMHGRVETQEAIANRNERLRALGYLE